MLIESGIVNRKGELIIQDLMVLERGNNNSGVKSLKLDLNGNEREEKEGNGNWDW